MIPQSLNDQNRNHFSQLVKSQINTLNLQFEAILGEEDPIAFSKEAVISAKNLEIGADVRLDNLCKNFFYDEVALSDFNKTISDCEVYSNKTKTEFSYLNKPFKNLAVIMQECSNKFKPTKKLQDEINKFNRIAAKTQPVQGLKANAVDSSATFGK